MRGKADTLFQRAHRNEFTLSSSFRKTSTLLASAFCAGALFCHFSSYANDDNQSRLNTIQQHIAEKEKQVARQKTAQSQLSAQLKNQEKAIAEASRKLHQIRQAITLLNNDIEQHTHTIARLQKKQISQEKLLAGQLDAAFRQGKHSELQLLLTPEESQRNERLLVWFSYLNASRRESINQLQATRQELSTKKESLQQKQRQQQNLLAGQQTQQENLIQARQSRQKTLTALTSSLEKDQADLTDMRQNEKHLQNSIAKAEREAKVRAEREAREAESVRQRQARATANGSSYQPSANEQALIARTGGLGRPNGSALWPVHGTVIHRFGETMQGELYWKGLVIGVSEGTEVKAIAAGRVLMADWLQGYGLMVVIEHGKGDMSLYGYNESALVSTGTQVRAGQPIALAGTSGGQQTPALYFEIRRQGQAVNPLPWLGK